MPIYNPNTAPSVILTVTSKTTTYTATTGDDVILVDTSGGAWTLTLYAASGNSGKVLRVVKTTSDTNALTIDGNASETINGFANIKLNYQFDEVTLVCDGTNWNIISQIKTPTVQTFLSGSGTYTAAFGVKYLKVTMVGGGGGGQRGGTTFGSDQTNGGNTTFGSSLLTANGGTAAANTSGGAGGSASVSAPAIGYAMTGNAGHSSSQNGAAVYVAGGGGGASVFGGAGSGGSASNGASAATNSGSGGGGGGSGNASGNHAGAGGGSGGRLYAFIANPASSYSYVVGSGGGGASGGTFSGGNGGSGQIVIEEHYQ